MRLRNRSRHHGREFGPRPPTARAKMRAVSGRGTRSAPRRQPAYAHGRQAIEGRHDRLPRRAGPGASVRAPARRCLDRRARGPRRRLLDHRLATGGMGEIWAAWDPQLRRELAVKLVRPDRADRARERDRLLREARALARLGHPNVLAIHDVGEVGGEVFLATGLVAGDTLEQRGGVTAGELAAGRRRAGACGRLRPGGPRARRPAARQRHPPRWRGGRCAGRLGLDHRPPGTWSARGPICRRAAAGAPVDARADQYALCIALAESIGGDRPSGDPDAAN